MTPIQILELLARLNDKADISDTAAALRFNARFSDAATLSAWQAFQAHPGPALSQVAISVDASDVPLGVDDPFVAGRRYRFNLAKQVVGSELRLFYLAGITSAVLTEASGRRLRVAELRQDQSFAARGLSVEPWTSADAAPPLLAVGEAIDPSKRVFDLASPRIVPADLRPWILQSAPSAEGGAYAAWKAEAAIRLWASLVDQVAGTATQSRYRLNGPPVVEMDTSDLDIAGAFWPIHAAAEWVFVGASDQDARHLLFAIELAHTLRASKASLGDAVPLALENAKSAYRAHIQSANRETLKALADLRRAVIDETQKTVERTQELTAALWRDLLIAAAPFVIKLVPDSWKIASRPVAQAFLIVAALYLAGSFAALTLVNRDYFREQDRARSEWQSSLVRYLPIAEVEGISDNPIKAAAKMYVAIHRGVGVFYALLILALLVAAFSH